MAKDLEKFIGLGCVKVGRGVRGSRGEIIGRIGRGSSVTWDLHQEREENPREFSD